MKITRCDRCGKIIVPDAMIKDRTGEFKIIIVYDMPETYQEIQLCETCLKLFLAVNGPLHQFMENDQIKLIRKNNLSKPLGPELTEDEKNRLNEILNINTKSNREE